MDYYVKIKLISQVWQQQNKFTIQYMPLKKPPLMKGGLGQMVTDYSGTVLWSCHHFAHGHLLELVHCVGHLPQARATAWRKCSGACLLQAFP